MMRVIDGMENAPLRLFKRETFLHTRTHTPIRMPFPFRTSIE